MSKILNTVSSAFAVTRDALISYNIAEKGSSSLLTGVYEEKDPITDGFYSKPDITGNGESTKAAIIYGEVMITPFLIDMGVDSATNDPSSILKTYRFIAGDGVNSGPVTGPNGTPLENIYIRDPNGIPQPVVDSDGRPSMSNVLLASALGSAITSAPKLWDAIKGSAPASSQTSTVDPVTGKPLLSVTDKNAQDLAKKLSLGELSNVDESGKGDNYVLTYDATKGVWVAKSFNTGISDSGALSSSTVCGGSGGSGGNGGAGGDGGDGGSGGTTPEVPPECTPTSSFVQYPCDPAPMVVKDGMVLLPTLANTANNEYSQSIPVVSTNGIELHFYTAGCGKRAVWNIANADIENCSSTDSYSCFEDPTKQEAQTPTLVGGQIEYLDPASISIKVCITADICGSEYLIYSGTISETALSKTAYTFNRTILWSNTKAGALLTAFPGQLFNSTNNNVKLYLSRTDDCGSEFDLYFEGYKRLLGNTYYRPTISAKTSAGGTSTPKPTPVQVKADDGKFPDQKPSGGGMGAPTCIEDAPLPGTLPTAGEPGQPGTSGGTGTAGTCGDITVPPPKVQPTIKLSGPCARQYGNQTSPPAFDAVTLPTFTSTTGITNQTVNVFYEITTGNGTFQISGAIPGSVTAIPSGRSLQLTGPRADVETASSKVQIVPAVGSGGDIHYTVVIENAENTKAGTSCMLVPKQIIIKDSVSATAKVCIDNSTSGGTGKVMITFNDKTADLTNGYVSYTGSPTATAAAIAANINANVAVKNALAPTDAAWLPAFAASASGLEVTITAPAAGGSDFNGIELSTAVTSGFVFGTCVGTFLGGITKTINDFLKNNIPNWDAVSNVLLGIAGNTLGAVLTNVIMNNTSQIQISIPTEEDVDVIFLYRGRIIRVPNEYNGAARTGSPVDYNAWSGVWKEEYTTNPAWVVWDFITNKKYGMGNDLQLTATQEQNLLRDLFPIAKYCDDIIGTKPRFSTNTVITEGTKLQILEQLCSVFFGGYYFYSGGLRITIDKQDLTPKLLVNQANASEFDKSFTNARTFVNKVRLSYVEPSNFYTENIVVAESDNAIETYGERTVDLVAFGCTDVDQAKRQASWILNSEIENSININYTGGFDHYILKPGDIVEYWDSNERGIRRAGRIVSQSGTNVVLDAPIVAVAGDYFSLTCSDGSIHNTTISSIAGTNVVLTAAPTVSALPWATFIAAPISGKKLYKVIKVDETSTAKFATSLQLYNPDKY